MMFSMIIVPSFQMGLEHTLQTHRRARRLIVLPFLDVPTFATSLSSSVQPERPLVAKGGTA